MKNLFKNNFIFGLKYILILIKLKLLVIKLGLELLILILLIYNYKRIKNLKILILKYKLFRNNN